MSAKFVENTVIELINGKVVMSRSDLAIPPFSIDPKDWYAIKDAIDELVPIKRRLTDQEQIEKTKADPELFRAMTFYGLDFFYAQYHSVKVQYDDFKYIIVLVGHKPYSENEMIFDTADELKAELFKLKSADVDHSFNVDFDDIFDSFMFGVNDIKQHYGIGGDDE